eukprot:6180524-Pleurochrysis_carterae.AAC.5
MPTFATTGKSTVSSWDKTGQIASNKRESIQKVFLLLTSILTHLLPYAGKNRIKSAHSCSRFSPFRGRLGAVKPSYENLLGEI